MDLGYSKLYNCNIVNVQNGDKFRDVVEFAEENDALCNTEETDVEACVTLGESASDFYYVVKLPYQSEMLYSWKALWYNMKDIQTIQ